MNQLTYLMDEICCGLEVYYSGRTGGQYLKMAFILCDDYAELVSKLFLLEDDLNWSDQKGSGKFKPVHEIMKEVVCVFRTKRAEDLAKVQELKGQIHSRRHRRNDFFHSTHLLDLNVNARACVDAFCDLLEYGELLFPDKWRMALGSCRQMETLETLLQLERKGFTDSTINAKVNDIMKRWPRRGQDKSSISKFGTQYTEYPEDLHLRLCIIWGGRELCDKLKTLL